MTKRAKLIKCDGTVTDVELCTDNLDHMYQLLGCTMVECLKVAEGFDIGVDLWVDEEGLFKENILPNLIASEIRSRHVGVPVCLVGDCILAGSMLGDDEEVHIADLPLLYCSWIDALARSIQPTLRELPEKKEKV